MKSLKYLLLTTIKNYFKSLKNHPAQLVLVIIFTLMLGFAIVAGSMGGGEHMTDVRNISELYAIILALYFLIFVMMSLQGLSSGASFYSMADISMLFCAPISSQRILIYGLVKQMGTSLFVGFFLLFQYGWMHNVYNISFGGLVLILLGYCLVMFCGQLTAMVIYTFTSGSDKSKKWVKALIYTLCIVVIADIAVPLLSNKQDVLGCLVASSNAPMLKLIPVAGWVQAIVAGGISANLIPMLIGLIAIIAYIVGFIFLISKSRSDFYEDVLQATEVSFSAITARKEGKMAETMPTKIKTGKIGIGKGAGADVLFYKHMLENRRAKVFLLDATSLIFVATSIAFSFFIREAGILPIFFFSVYMQIFSSAICRWTRELVRPYIYLIPVSPFQKLVMACQENVLKICTESVVIFLPVGLILQLSVWEMLACIVARIGFGLLFMAGNILIERVLGSLTNKIIIMSLYFIILMVLAAPGLIIGLLLSFNIMGDISILIILSATFVWNLVAASGVTFFCRDILNYAELNNR